MAQSATKLGRTDKVFLIGLFVWILALIGGPFAFEQFNDGGNPYTGPFVQTVLDVILFGLLFAPRFRDPVFRLAKPEGWPLSQQSQNACALPTQTKARKRTKT